MAETTVVKFEDKKIRDLLSSIAKQNKKISSRAFDFVSLLSAIVLGDIEDHFANEQGPEGRWKAWSAIYRRRMVALGKGGNLILSDTGRLRRGWQPTKYRASSDGILWFNPVNYASVHDEGSRIMPRRQFSWLSNSAINRMEKETAEFLLK